MPIIAVTGSSGLIGRELVRQLRAQNHQLVEIDIELNNTYDIANSNFVAELIQSCDGIIHLAAVSRVAEAQKHPLRTWATNVTGTYNILDAALQRKGKTRPWVIHASSREVYGNQPRKPIPEDTPIMPLNIYGRSKAVGEAMVMVPRMPEQTFPFCDLPMFTAIFTIIQIVLFPHFRAQQSMAPHFVLTMPKPVWISPM